MLLLVVAFLAYLINRLLSNVVLFFVAAFLVVPPVLPGGIGVYAFGGAALYWLGWPFTWSRTPVILASIWFALFSIDKATRREALIAVIDHAIQWLVLFVVSLYPGVLALVASLLWLPSRAYSAPAVSLLLLSHGSGLFAIASCIRFDQGQERLWTLAATRLSGSVKLALACLQFAPFSETSKSEFWRCIAYIALGCWLSQ